MSDSDVDVPQSKTQKSTTGPRAKVGQSPPVKSVNADPVAISDLELQLDRISLNQALSDTEAATARVIDLTERLVDARRQITELRGEFEQLRIEHHQDRAEAEAMRGSGAFRIATVIWDIRNALHL